jgi:hypothetical protein
MKININFDRLENARKSMGADKATFALKKTNDGYERPSFKVELEEKGHVILTAEEVKEHVQFTAGLISAEGEPGTLHIYNPHHAELEDLEMRPAEKPKYHIAPCRTLLYMQDIGRYDRYVFTTKAKLKESNNLFKVVPWDKEKQKRGNEIEAMLLPCKNCLKQLDYRDYDTKNWKERNNFVKNFDLPEFFEYYDYVYISILPKFSHHNFPIGEYSEDWAKISNKKRELDNFICEQCRIDCSKDTGLVHVHHKDGNIGNNKPSNLSTLCLYCHSEQPFHNSLKKLNPKNYEKIINLRDKQLCV